MRYYSTKVALGRINMVIIVMTKYVTDVQKVK